METAKLKQAVQEYKKETDAATERVRKAVEKVREDRTNLRGTLPHYQQPSP